MHRWTMVLSEYLDLPVILRESGEPVVSVRSALEALECLENWAPARLVIDTDVAGHDQVLHMVRTYFPDTRVEYYEEAVDRMLALAM